MVKRPKTTPQEALMLARWAVIFHCGRDYFGDLDHLTADKQRELTKRAWRQLGRIYLAGWAEANGYSAKPWALKEFGPP